MTQSVLHLAGLDWPVPDYSTVSRRQKTLQVTIGAVPSTTGLHLLVDSTGIKMLGEREWKAKKHSAITSADGARSISGSTLPRSRSGHGGHRHSIDDAPFLPALLGPIPADECIASVSGDGAYDKNSCHKAIALRCACHHSNP